MTEWTDLPDTQRDVLAAILRLGREGAYGPDAEAITTTINETLDRQRSAEDVRRALDALTSRGLVRRGGRDPTRRWVTDAGWDVVVDHLRETRAIDDDRELIADGGEEMCPHCDGPKGDIPLAAHISRCCPGKDVDIDKVLLTDGGTPPHDVDDTDPLDGAGLVMGGLPGAAGRTGR